jgi:hypothetical protein
MFVRGSFSFGGLYQLESGVIWCELCKVTVSRQMMHLGEHGRRHARTARHLAAVHCVDRVALLRAARALRSLEAPAVAGF